MRKIIFLFSSFFILFLFSAFWNNKVYAACSLNIEGNQPPVFSPDFNGPIKIIGSDGCFATTGGITYIILGYPLNINSSPQLYFNYSIYRKQASETNSITAQLDLTKSSWSATIGKDNPGSWIVKVCKANSTADCGGDSSSNGNVLGNVIPITVSGVLAPTPTPIPSNLPIASVFPNKCTYQINSPVGFILDKLQLNTNYRWWWDEDPGVKNDVIRTSSSPSATLNIPGSETTQVRIQIFCVDIEGLRRCRSGSQNSVTLRFTLDSPPNDGSAACITTSTGKQDLQNIPTPTPIAPPPPCSQWVDLSGTPIPTESPNIQNADYPKKCASVSTGLGIDIKTDAGDLVKSVFGVILSISGGIALILIIISGYQLIFSQGNPEAVKAAQERLTSAIVGLLFIIFSLVILQIIGADILKIPGFSK